MGFARMPQRICDAFVERKHNSPVGTRGLHNHGIRGTLQVLVEYRVAVVTAGSKVFEEIDWKILVQLEFQ
ncbi:MAG: hypothetical protein JWN34_1264 [Bryobacterales bacterium]|jgi:hypothetical protein|nr:hypothetical protein [Bryobacterales bacterium]